MAPNGVESAAQRSQPRSTSQSAVGFFFSLQPTVERKQESSSQGERIIKRDLLGPCEHIRTTLTSTGDRIKLQVSGKQEVLREVDVG